MLQRSFDDRGRLDLRGAADEPGAVRLAARRSLRAGPGRGRRPTTFGPDRITRNVYDAAGQRLQHAGRRRQPAIEAAEATWAYNGNGQVTAVIDGNGNRAELRYDGHMRQDRWTFPHDAAGL